MISKINIDIINSLSHLEIEALRYIEANACKVVELSIKDLSNQSFISTATIMRLCKKLGYSGFSEFKYDLKKELDNTECENDFSFEKTINDSILAITETAKMLDYNMIMEVIEKMDNAKHIHFFAKGLSGNVLQYASKLLLTKGIANTFYTDTHIAHIAASKMNEQDLLILASLSGETTQVLKMAQIAKARNVTVVVLTGNTINELAKLGNYNFGFFCDKYAVRPTDTSSRVQLLFVLNIIFTTYYNTQKTRFSE